MEHGDPELESSAPPAGSEGANLSAAGWTYWVMVLISGVVIAICVTTEVLNLRAGSILPLARPERGNAKWRMDSDEWEHSWLRSRHLVELERRGGGYVWVRVRELSPDERVGMHQDMAEAKSKNDVARWLRSICCLQYTLLPIAFFGLLGQAARGRIPRRQRALVMGLAVAVAVCGCLAWYRDYTRSLLD
ncbi:MAG: hypothetical protein R3F62_13420 [Planctomycetota bacterium]